MVHKHAQTRRTVSLKLATKSFVRALEFSSSSSSSSSAVGSSGERDRSAEGRMRVQVSEKSILYKKFHKKFFSSDTSAEMMTAAIEHC